jgi:hypothetical protein
VIEFSVGEVPEGLVMLIYLLNLYKNYMALPVSSTIRKIATQMCAAQRNSFTISNTPNVLPNHLLRE